MSDNEYISRIFDGIVEFTLKSKGALVIVGPKWCGKSTTAKRYAQTVIDLMPLESRNEFIELGPSKPESASRRLRSWFPNKPATPYGEARSCQTCNYAQTPVPEYKGHR